MKIAIAGFGALGSRLGIKLQQAGHDVTGIDGWPAQIAAINTNGLTVKSDGQTDKVYYVPVMAPSEVTGQTFDLIVLLTKTPQLRQMLTDIQGLIRPATQLLILSNGLGNTEIMREFVPENQMMAGTTLWTSQLLAPGVIRTTGKGSIRLQALGNQSQQAQTVCDVLNSAELDATLSTNVLADIWHKAAINSVVNPLSVVLDANIVQCGTASNHMEFALTLLEEIRQVADCINMPLDVKKIMASLAQLLDPVVAGDHYPSMYQDIANANRTEIDCLNGYFVKLGREHGLNLPVNATLTALIHAKEDIVRAKKAKQKETFAL